MSKRSNFGKVPKDFYPTTDPKAVPPKLVDFIRGKTYAEPCYGNGDLEDLLMDVATCKWRSDIRETVGSSKVMDALEVTKEDLNECDLIATNPPFSKDVLLPLINHFVSLKPTWLLLPADYMHNIYFGPYMDKCSKVVSVGRVCWFPKEGKRVASTENFAWYFWKQGATTDTETVFYGR
jgi:hypothetical protein